MNTPETTYFLSRMPQIKPLLKFFTATLIVGQLAGCNSSNESLLQIRHSFEANKTSTPQQFKILMTWFVPPSVLFGSERNSIVENMGLSTRPHVNRSLSIDNERRLKLEDIAIKRLESELAANQMCDDGYKINHTKWLERSIQFIGSCS
ncbi:hypothetical protein [Aliiglaciecola sp. LCG003]|uniref:hypothetical protein n=1 Tax=Aliiglaciecola sp. LCG003 TaxID=3053655 RepID=UPI002572C5C5|nr:hypothetical protein [Aliiglaciecola sp. LCG003]WJG10476.1 hypothetical protein QR722_05395 [Aliiglaciecola sp. LCG003]